MCLVLTASDWSREREHFGIESINHQSDAILDHTMQTVNAMFQSHISPLVCISCCRALVYVSLNASVTAVGLSGTAAVPTLSNVLGVSETTINDVNLTQQSHTLAFTLSPAIIGRTLSNEDILGSIGGQNWSLDVRVQRTQGELLTCLCDIEFVQLLHASPDASVMNDESHILTMHACDVR